METKKEPPSLISYFFIVWGSICSQGLHTVSTEDFSVRVVSWVTLLFGLCISTSYSAVLFSRLTVDKSDLSFPTLESVARLRTHVLCIRRNSFGALLFKKRETDKVMMDRWIGIVNEPPCPQHEYGDIVAIAKTVCSSNNLLVLETPNLMSKAMADQNGCRVVSLAGRHGVAYASLLTTKRLLSILTNGISDYLQKKWLSREFQDLPMTEVDSIGVTIGHVQGLLVVFGLSIAIATTIMMFELAYRNFGWPQSFWQRRSSRRLKFPRFYQ